MRKNNVQQVASLQSNSRVTIFRYRKKFALAHMNFFGHIFCIVWITCSLKKEFDVFRFDFEKIFSKIFKMTNLRFNFLAKARFSTILGSLIFISGSSSNTLGTCLRTATPFWPFSPLAINYSKKLESYPIQKNQEIPQNRKP